MSLTIQTINLAGSQGTITATLPAHHIYPFVIHRRIAEHRQKKNGERQRYSSKVTISHLLTGGLLADCPDYEEAWHIVEGLKEEPIFLMPTVELLYLHPDRERVDNKIVALRKLHASWIRHP